LGFEQITRTTPRRRMILQRSQRTLTDADTFMLVSATPLFHNRSFGAAPDHFRCLQTTISMTPATAE
jgi:hypothetical protein